MDEIVCRNCGEKLSGKFCSNCGQKIVAGRFTVKEILHNFFHTFTHVDSGIIYLAKELFVRPGDVVKEYINGRRKVYFNPLQYLIILIAVGTFLAVNFNLFGPKINPDTIKGLTEQERWGLQFNNFIYRYFNAILFLVVPVSALYSWLLFRKSGYNYAENLILNVFLAAQRTLMYILITPFLYFFRDLWLPIIAVYYLLWIIYFVFAFKQFFDGKGSSVILKSLLIIFLIFLTSQSVSMTIFAIFFYH